MGQKNDYVLQQKQLKGTNKPIEYWYCSPLLNNVEWAYETTQWECLEIVLAVLLLWPYLEGCKFTVSTDNKGLKWTLNATYSTSKLVHWRLRLSEIGFDVIPPRWYKHQAADELSSLGITEIDQSPMDDDIPVLCITASISSEKNGGWLWIC